MWSAYDRWKLMTPEEAAGIPWCKACDCHHDGDCPPDEPPETSLCDEQGCVDDGGGTCGRGGAVMKTTRPHRIRWGRFFVAGGLSPLGLTASVA